MKRIYQQLVIVALCLGAFCSCSKQLNLTPETSVAESSLTAGDIPQLRTGVYSSMENVVFNFYFDWDVRGENLQAGPGFSLIDPISTTPQSPTITSLWQNAYIAISKVNFLITTVDNLGNNVPATDLSYKGEALYFRALLYYFLATRWGGVPIVLTNTYNPIQRSSEDSVWMQIKSDLSSARALVGTFSNGFYVSDQAVKALMAKVYLATGDNANAALYADSVINSGHFSLATDSISYANIFIPATTSKELIFGLANNTTSNEHVLYSAINGTEGTFSYSPALAQYDSLFGDQAAPVLKAQDKRKSAVFTSDATRCIKYGNGKSGQELVTIASPAIEPMMITRISEMYLTFAEASGPSAGSTLLATYLANRYHTAPSAASIAALSTQDYQNLILNERRREFYLEGQWWYDVKRTGRTDLFRTLNGRSYLLYYPVPQTEINLTGYSQNDGY